MLDIFLLRKDLDTAIARLETRLDSPVRIYVKRDDLMGLGESDRMTLLFKKAK